MLIVFGYVKLSSFCDFVGLVIVYAVIVGKKTTAAGFEPAREIPTDF